MKSERESEIEGLTREINRLGDSFYEKTSDITRQLCAERINALESTRAKLLKEEEVS